MCVGLSGPVLILSIGAPLIGCQFQKDPIASMGTPAMSNLEWCLFGYCTLVSIMGIDLLIKNHDLRKKIAEMKEKDFKR